MPIATSATAPCPASFCRADTPSELPCRTFSQSSTKPTNPMPTRHQSEASTRTLGRAQSRTAGTIAAPMSRPPMVGTFPPSLASSPMSSLERSGWRRRDKARIIGPESSRPSASAVKPARMARTEMYSKSRNGPQ